MPQFPLNITTENGSKAVVTNPMDGCYIFYIMSPMPYRTFEWYTPYFIGLKPARKVVGEYDEVEKALLQAFTSQLEAGDGQLL